MSAMFGKYLTTAPRMEHIPSFDPRPEAGWEGVKALWYEGAPYKGKKTKVFAYMGVPEVKPGEKVPAVVLVHGGGGHAFAHWVKLWNDRGYAAISMDNTGFFPHPDYKGLTGNEKGPNEVYVTELYGELVEDGYTCGPAGSGMRDVEDTPLEDQWMYHAVVDTILANNILRADDRIDTEKIGIMGVSWGGVITSITLGHDGRYAFAVPVYGSAYLEDGPESLVFSNPFRTAQARKYWCATDHIAQVKVPALWECYLSDVCFCPINNSQTYLDTKGNGSIFSLQEKLTHGHWPAWAYEYSYRFADCILAGKKPLIIPQDEPCGTGEISFRIDIPEDFTDVQAKLFYMNEPYRYDPETRALLTPYFCEEATVTEDVVTANVPDSAYSYYVELSGCVNGVRLISSTSVMIPSGVYK